jgi:hypothetical protein
LGTRETWSPVIPVDPAAAVAAVVFARTLAALAFAFALVVVDPDVVPVVPPEVTAGVMWVKIRTEQVTTLPPGLPVPLHWFTLTGMAGLTTEAESTVQWTVPPPPVPDPLHWVTVAPVVVAGKG